MDQIKSILLLLILISKIQPSCFFLPFSINKSPFPLSPTLNFSFPLPPFSIQKIYSLSQNSQISPHLQFFKGQHSQAISLHPPSLLLSLISNCSLKAQIPPHPFPFFSHTQMSASLRQNSPTGIYAS
jgi:hypothetical protein